MKKGILVLGLGMLVLSSCVKDRVCTCTTSGAGYSGTETYVYKSTKKSAQAACDANEESNSYYTTVCELN